MDEVTLQQSLDLYNGQLAQIEQAIAAAGETEELNQLRSDLQEVISLTEGSLLSLRKSQLLKTLEDAENSVSSTQDEGGGGGESTLDDEYAAFMAMMNDDDEDGSQSQPMPSAANTTSSITTTSSAVSASSFPITVKDTETPAENNVDSNSDDSDSSDSSDAGENTDVALPSAVDEELSNLVGMKCRAPFSHDWGKLDYHNAIVMSAERKEDTDEIMVKVMFTTPTHVSMLPCKFFLDGRCRFSDDKCRYSHGYTVTLEKLREFLEADHSNVSVGTKCLAQYTDRVWYPATVTDIKADEGVSVHFDDYNEDMDVEMSQIVPAVVHEASGSDSEKEEDEPVAGPSGQGREPVQDSDDEDGEELPVYLWKPPQTTAALGEWEAHTKGIGSKLMAKMGYIVGQGLGAGGQGKAEPVPILLLPQGKSLDRIMELKEMAGDSNLFNAMKKLEKQKAKAEKKREQQAAAAAQGQGHGHANVFDFINKKLHGKKGDLASLGASGGRHSAHAGGDNASGQAGKRNISEHELHKKSDRDINLQVFKTHEEIRNVERQIDRLRESLARNENKDRAMAAQVRGRLSEQEAYLASLKSSSSALDKHQKKRSHSKKLAIF